MTLSQRPLQLSSITPRMASIAWVIAELITYVYFSTNDPHTHTQQTHATLNRFQCSTDDIHRTNTTTRFMHGSTGPVGWSYEGDLAAAGACKRTVGMAKTMYIPHTLRWDVWGS